MNGTFNKVQCPICPAWGYKSSTEQIKEHMKTHDLQNHTEEPIACICCCHLHGQLPSCTDTCEHCSSTPLKGDCKQKTIDCKGDWKEDFYKKFIYIDIRNVEYLNESDPEKVINFIESLLQQDRQRIVEALEKGKKEYKHIPDEILGLDMKDYLDGYNDGMDKSIEIVNNREEVKE